MNKFVAVAFFAFIAVSWAASLGEPDHAAAHESREKFKKAHEKCQADPATAVDESALKALREGGAPPANHAAHALCISQALGWQNADGSVNKEAIKSRAEHIFGSSPKLSEIIDECSLPQASPAETAVHITKCYAKHSPRPEGHGPHDH
ncbi:uncharacterized protein LOC115880499 [Sitophilus oryzae]|uniref:Uncharacterized protein LOC115880499 n=1 Tax=Sitophilus oryzae TaxID=7048 RepID=A0A6J2XQB8_SITOR|nr:uncharacterized protein LOC115880499 [Sitophilus oryzae]